MFLVDTDVLSEPTRRHPMASVVTWLQSQVSFRVSAISLIEIEYGLARLDGARRARLTRWFEGTLSAPGIEVVPIDTTVARAAGRMKRLAEATGRSRPFADLIIVACAQVTGSVIATRNTADFEGLGVPILNPFVG